ncbi:unnamed protein product [Adineta ricciae]|uniref:Uncharacterized protein n=1 Tax=Adineta ricciae TaxID=249248 RepID=A0A815IPY9_ADIRI|nr:unnamed protein product [Adineta ricciae]
MYKNNWTSWTLVNLMAPYDLIDNYQNYIDNNQLVHQQLYYCRCKNEQTFGPHCQYTFRGQYEYRRFHEYFGAYYNFKNDMPIESMYEITNGTCYVDLNCTVNSLCLQWNEVCDGKRDCFNGEDEQNCSIFEFFECNDDYRCLNGFHCVPKEFTMDFSLDCTDGSDEQVYTICSSKLFPFECSDVHCGWESFSCGDGECIEFQFNSNDPDDEHCENQRDWYYIQNLLIKSETMNEDCWTSVLCLFGLEKYFPFDITKCVRKLNECTELIRFPFTKYLYLNYHVYFLYEKETSMNKTRNMINPDYICYDGQRCSKVCSQNRTIMDGIHTCCPIKFRKSFRKSEWANLYSSVSGVFDKQCLSIYYPELDSNRTNNCSNSLFHCPNTQKCISRHRVFDGVPNCYDEFDEDKNVDSCQLNIPNRFQCSTSKHQCIPKYFVMNGEINCVDESDEKFPEKCLYLFQTSYACDFIRGITSFPIHNYVFKDVCNGIIEHQYENETDESDCHLWPCASPSTLCNVKWHCPNGFDEVRCPHTHHSNTFERVCELNEHACIDVLTRNWSCLPLDRAGDQSVDCIGGIDEQYNNSCSQNTTCLSPSKLCDGIDDCPFGADETMVCPWLNINSSKCDLKRNFRCRDGVCVNRKYQCDGIFHCTDKADEWFCWNKKHATSNQKTMVVSQTRRDLSGIDVNKHSWFCNLGFPIYGIDNKTIESCLCPPAFYGERCQYQSNRIILTYRIDVPGYLENQMLKFVFFLYNTNTTEIVDYDEIVFLPLRTTFQPTKHYIYLVYSQKDIRNRQNGMIYAVHVNAYFVTISNLEFKCAWLFDIPGHMNILPVQRIVSRLIIDAQRLYFQCSSKRYCNSNGLCKQYMNHPDLFYCYCYSQWFGNQCQYRIPSTFSSVCSAGSATIYDSVHMKSICICLSSQTGPTCRVPRVYCDKSMCKNNGICLLMTARDWIAKTACLCSEQYAGQQCQAESLQTSLKLSDFLLADTDLSAIIYYFVVFLPTNLTSSAVPYYHTEEEEISFRLNIRQTKLMTTDLQSISTIYVRRMYYGTLISASVEHYLSIVQVYFSNLTEQLYYYNHNYTNSSMKRLTVPIGDSRCLSTRDLFNTTVLESHPLKRLKYYHQPCIENLTTCFYDHVYLCLCSHRYRFAKCYLFSYDRSQCSRNICQNQGKCLQDDERSNTLNTKCLCQKCYHGKLCQYSTSDYSLSLDVLLSEGLNLPLNTPMFEQTILIQICFYIIILFVFLGLIFNLLTFVTFCQADTRETGSGIYLLILSIINQFDLVLLLIRYFFLVRLETKLYFCKLFEYLAKFSPAISDWLSTFVTIDRAYSLYLAPKFDKEIIDNLFA